MRGITRGRVLWSIGVGAVLEFVVVISLSSQRSDEPPTRWQEVLGYTQSPWIVLTRIFESVPADSLPLSLNFPILIASLAAGFLFQSATLGAPVLLAILAWNARRPSGKL